MKLEDLINRKVVVLLVPGLFDDHKLGSATLLDVEEQGIWIESQEATDAVLAKFGVKPSAQTPAFFIPFAQIITILAHFDRSSAAAPAGSRA